MIEGLILTPLKQINHPKGDIYHGMKQSDNGFFGFGEAYFSTIQKDEIKGWKKHTQMILNLIVPLGEIEFIIYDDREKSATFNEFFSVKLSQKNYKRLTVPVGVWMAFRGISDGTNMLLNIASIEHDPSEALVRELNEINYNWN
jgi:dTDP-4-dehydrorhamnose 3,5-epimerase